MIGARAERTLLASTVALVLAAQLFLLVPFTLYLGNANEFVVTFGAAFSVWLPLAVLMAGCLMLAAMLLPEAWRPAWQNLLAGLSIAVGLQANIMVWDYGPLDGRLIDWREGSWRGWLDAGVWGVLVTVAVLASGRVAQFLFRAAVVLFILQSVLLASQALRDEPDAWGNTAAGDPGTLEEVLRFSASKNVVHIIADGFQSDIFAQIVAEAGVGEQAQAAMRGFTFFREHMGVFPYTHMTVPALLSGRIYRNDRPIREHMAATVSGDNILSVAMEAGYEVDLVVPGGGSLEKMYARAPHTRFYPVRAGTPGRSDASHYHAAAKLLDLTLFRIAPHFVKPAVYNEQSWRLQPLLAEQDLATYIFFSHLRFLQELRTRMSAPREVPVYKLIHLMLSHKPMVTTRACEFAGETLPTTRETVLDQARCGLFEVVQLLDRMKSLGIYDDATIVLMGDHGVFVDPVGMTGAVGPDGVTHTMNPEVIALSVPLLAIKRPGERGPLKASSAPSWIVDTASTIATIEGWEAQFPGRPVFALEVDEPRERQFYFYEYRRSELWAEYLAPITEFLVEGSVFQSGSWRYVTTHHPGGRSERQEEHVPPWQSRRPGAASTDAH